MSGQNLLLLGAVQQAVASDPYFENTTLLLPGNGTNGAQNNTFLDSSTNAFSITRNGNTTQGTFSPFSQTGWSNYFDGTGDYLTAPDNAAYAFGTGDFTVECWVFTGTSATQCVAGQGDSTGTRTSRSFLLYASLTGNPYFTVGHTGNNSVDLTSSSALPLNQWNHIAGVRDGATLRLYLNGVQVATGSISTASANDSTNAMTIGRSGDYNGEYLTGYCSNFRVLKGTCLYPSGTTFTPSTTPLTAITNTSLLTCQSNRFIDNSTNAFAITRNGDVSVQAFSPFNPTAAWSAATNGGSGYFDGSGDSLTLASNAAFAPGTGDFTVEAWIYPKAAWGTWNGVFVVDVSGGIFFGKLDTGFGLRAFAVANIVSTTAPDINTWTHVAVSRSGTTVRLFINGALAASATSSQNFGQGTAYIGNSPSPGEDFSGYISGLRLVKGTAVYTAAFTPPTAPLTAITNTSLLCNFTNAGIYDATSKNDLETVGNAQISTTQSKFGGSSMYFDGTGDYLFRNGASDLFVISSDYTVECWVYFNSTSGTQILVTYGTLPWYLCIGDITAGKAQFTWSSSAPTNYHAIGTTTLSTGTWYHIAGVRYGSNIYLYVNGVQEAVTAISGSPRSPSTNALAIGANAAGSSTANVYIQDVRITKGVARYTSAFTPPAAAFPVL